jgi:hypothetical protein
MDELMEIFRGMRSDADQAIQLLTSDQHAGHSNKEDAAAILNRVRTWRDEIDSLITQYSDARDERT